MIVPVVIISATLVILFTLVHFYLYPSLKAEKIKKRLSRIPKNFNGFAKKTTIQIINS